MAPEEGRSNGISVASGGADPAVAADAVRPLKSTDAAAAESDGGSAGGDGDRGLSSPVAGDPAGEGRGSENGGVEVGGGDRGVGSGEDERDDVVSGSPPPNEAVLVPNGEVAGGAGEEEHRVENSGGSICDVVGESGNVRGGFDSVGEEMGSVLPEFTNSPALEVEEGSEDDGLPGHVVDAKHAEPQEVERDEEQKSVDVEEDSMAIAEETVAVSEIIEKDIQICNCDGNPQMGTDGALASEVNEEEVSVGRELVEVEGLPCIERSDPVATEEETILVSETSDHQGAGGACDGLQEQNRSEPNSVLVEKDDCVGGELVEVEGLSHDRKLESLVIEEKKIGGLETSELHIYGCACDDLQMQSKTQPASTLEQQEVERGDWVDGGLVEAEGLLHDPRLDSLVTEEETIAVSEIQYENPVSGSACEEEDHVIGESVDVDLLHRERSDSAPSERERIDISDSREQQTEGCSCGGPQTQNKVEPTSVEAEKINSCDDESGDLTDGNEDPLIMDGGDEILIEKIACTHNIVSLEFSRDCSNAVEACGDVQRQNGLEEENGTASVNQDNPQNTDDDEKTVAKGDDIIVGIHQNGVASPSVEDPVGLSSDPRIYMARIPRLQDKSLGTQILHAEACFEERHRKREIIRMKICETMALLEEHKKNINDARNEERAAREAFYAKQQEVNVIYSAVDKIELANSIDYVDDKMQYLSHKMQHETISLKEEKELIREIKELKQKRNHMSKLTPETEMQKAFEQKGQIEEDLKRLRPELEQLRKELLQYEAKTKDARKKHDNEYKVLEDLRGQYKVADDLRQETFIETKTLKKQLYEKNKHFYKYRDDMRAAVTYSLSGDREALRNHCNNQVEKFMELWNKSNEFRNEYISANKNSTIRRFRTLDGRSLGPDEQPASFPNTTIRKSENSIEIPSTSYPVPPTRKQEKLGKSLEPQVSEISNDAENCNISNRSMRLSKQDPQTAIADPVSNKESKESNKESKEDEEEKERQNAADAELKRVADELARKEKLRKEQEAELKEKNRLEQITKAREAEERKRRKAEKARAAADIRARKEAEMKEKKRAKERQKEKAASATDVASGPSVADQSIPDLPLESAEMPENSMTLTARKSSRAPQVVKQQFKKIKPLPAPLRKKNRSKFPSWMWLSLSIVVVTILFLVAYYVFSSRTTHPKFDF